MPTPYKERGYRMLNVVNDLSRLEEDEAPSQELVTEFWAALRNFLPTHVGGMTRMCIDAHGNVDMTFLKSQE